MTAHSVNSFAPSLGVPCPTCKAGIGQACGQWHHEPGVLKGHFIERKRCHPARRRAADEKRTAEVRASLAE